MQKALLIVLTGALCVEGGVSDLPQSIDVPHGFPGFFKYLVEHTMCGLWSSMHIWTLSVLLRRLLPPDTLKGFLYIAGGDHPNKSVPYPNRGELLKHILGSPRVRASLWNQNIVLLEVDPLNWPLTRVVEPCIQVRDDVDPLELQRPYYIQKEVNVRETISLVE